MVRPATTGRTARHSDRGRPCHPSTAKEGRDGNDHRRTCAHCDRWRRHSPRRPSCRCTRSVGGLLGSEPFETTPAGYKALLDWLEGFGEVGKVGVEGTGSYGAGLARFLRRRRVEVVEVDRPNRQARRRQGKSDPLDAIEAARAALSGWAQGKAKTRDGAVEAIRALVVAKRSARQARVKALTQVRHLRNTAPDQLRCRMKGLSVPALVAEGAKLRLTKSADPVTAATKASLSSLAHRIQALDREIAERTLPPGGVRPQLDKPCGLRCLSPRGTLWKSLVRGWQRSPSRSPHEPGRL